MVDGLRITFDFTLPMILLYPCEQAQFKKVSSTRLFLAMNDTSPCSSRYDCLKQMHTQFLIAVLLLTLAV